MKTKKQNFSKKKKMILLSMVFVFFATIGIWKIKADSSSNVTGWFWGGSDNDNIQLSGDETGLGWISTNSSDCDTNNNGKIDAAEFAANPACPPTGTTVANYGLNFPPNGIISGYAWSENVGWISFNQSDLAGCPDGNCFARTNGNGAYLTGWARIISFCDGNSDGKCLAGETNSNAGGWNGWIKLSGTIKNTSTQYGIMLNADGTFNNTPSINPYAWSGNLDGSSELGWINFSRATAAVPKITLTASQSQFLLSQGQTFSTGNTTLTWTVAGVVGNCSATCTSGSCDPNWTSQTSAALSTSNPTGVSVQITGSTQFNIHCANLVQDATAVVSVGCHPNTCQSNICTANTSNFVQATDYATCAAAPNSTCTNTQDCTVRTSSNWKEIAPQ